MTDSVKPVTFKIILDTEDARKQLDALSKGGGKGSPDGKGAPQAPKPQGGAAGRAVGERGGSQASAPGRATASEGESALAMMKAAGGRIGAGGGGGTASGGFTSFLGGVNRAVVDPVGAAEGAAEGAVGGVLGTAAAVAAIIVASATFLEQIVPLILESLADSLPDMPFFKDWAREFDDDVSDKITAIRTWITSVIPTISETAGIDKAILQSGGTLPNQQDLFANLFGINWQQARFKADVEKESNKIAFKGIVKSLVEGMDK